MYFPSRLARRPDTRAPVGDGRSRVRLVIGGFLAAVVLIGLGLGRAFDVGVSRPPPLPTATVRAADAPIILTGNGSQTTEPFYLAGGRYRGDWAAWGPLAVYLPCTHSAQLMAVDPANATTSFGLVTDLAKLVHVPATGASYTSYLENIKPGDYYLDVSSECAWQIEFRPG